MNAPALKQRARTSQRIDRAMPASRIVDKFGGLTRFCQICDFPTSTVHSWVRRGLVPAQMRDGFSYAAWIMRCGEREGIEITAEDFIEQPYAEGQVGDG